MSRIVQPRVTQGSKHWLQKLVLEKAAALDNAIGLGALQWLSPVGTDEYAEYQDAAFLERLDVELKERPLDSFWPADGPLWDGLARTPFGINVLLTAIASIPETVSSCTASSPESVSMIQSAFHETKTAFDVDPDIDWCEGHYQYASRLAHAYLMRELNHVPTELVFLYFVGDADTGGPTHEEWVDVVLAMHDSLGVFGQLPRYVHDIFVDVSGRPTSVSV